MSEKPTPKLTDILARFNASSEKIASDDEEKKDGDHPDEEKKKEDRLDEEHEAEREESADEEDVSKSLTEIAEKAVSHHTDSLQKEAMLFGQLFADAAMDRMQKTAQFESIENEAYQYAMNELSQTKVASLYENAYFHTLQKLAEGEAYGMAMDQLQAPMQPVPEQGAMPVPSEMYPGMYPESIVPQEEEPLPEELLPEGDPEEAADMESVADAVTAAAEAAREAARAANTLAENFSAEPEGDIDLPKVAQEAYDVALQALRGAGAI